MGKILWGQTIKLFLLRSWAAGAVWFIGFALFLIILLPIDLAQRSLSKTLGVFSEVLPVALFNIGGAAITAPIQVIMLALIYYVFKWLAGVPAGPISFAIGLFAWLFGLSVSFIVSVGDPILYLLNKRYPRLLQLEGFKWFNFHIFIIVRERPG